MMPPWWAWVLVAAFAFLAWRLRIGVPGRLVYVDEERRSPLRNTGLMLAGKPDAVVRTWWLGPWNEHRPVELKSYAPPNTPYPGDVAQLIAHAFLVQATWGRFPR